MNYAGLDAGRYYEEFHRGMSSVKRIFLELFQAMRMNIEHWKWRFEHDCLNNPVFSSTDLQKSAFPFYMV